MSQESVRSSRYGHARLAESSASERGADFSHLNVIDGNGNLLKINNPQDFVGPDPIAGLGGSKDNESHLPELKLQPVRNTEAPQLPSGSSE